jgi:hypothetical protein
MLRRRSLWAFLMALVAAVALALPASCAKPQEPVLDVTPSSGTLLTGQTIQLVVTRRFPDGPSEVVTDRVSYLSSNKNAATVSDKGAVVGGTEAGLVSVRVEDPLSTAFAVASFAVSSVHIASIDVSPSPSVVMTPGSTRRFIATARLSDGTSKDVTSQLVWASTNEAAVTVVSTGAPAGQVVGTATAVTPGDTELTATDPTTSLQGGAFVFVREATADLLALVVSPNPATIPRGGQLQFSALGVFDDGTTRDLTKLVGWTSSAPGVATIDGTGLAQGSASGTTTITASASAAVPADAGAEAGTPDGGAKVVSGSAAASVP